MTISAPSKAHAGTEERAFSHVCDFPNSKRHITLTTHVGKRSARNDEIFDEGQRESDDTQDATDADIVNDSYERAAQGPNALSDPSLFTFSVDEAQTVNDLPDCESLDEQDDHQKLGNILAEDSTLAFIFGSPVKSNFAPLSTSPAKIGSLPHSEEEKEKLEASHEQLVSEEIVVTEPTVKSWNAC